MLRLASLYKVFIFDKKLITMSVLELKRKLHQLIDDEQNEALLKALYTDLQDWTIQKTSADSISIEPLESTKPNLLKHLSAFMEKNDNLLKRLAQ
jgi:hypothetical protein